MKTFVFPELVECVGIENLLNAKKDGSYRLRFLC